MRARERANHPIELLSASIDGELRPDEAAALEAHLEGCEECRGFLVDFKRLDREVAAEAPPVAPTGLRERILAQVATRTAPAVVPFWKRAMPLAAAASLVVAVILWSARPDRLPSLSEQVAVEADAPARSSDGPVGKDSPPEIHPEAAPPAPLTAPQAPRPERKPAAAADGVAGTRAKQNRVDGWIGNAGVPAEAPPPPPSPPAMAPQPKADEEKASEEGPARQLKEEPQASGNDDQLEALRGLGDVGTSAPDVNARAAPPVAMRVARPAAPTAGVSAPPYVIRLTADRVMRVESGAYACETPIEDPDAQLIAAVIETSLRVPGKASAPVPKSAGSAAAPSPAPAIVPASAEGRRALLRLVQERYAHLLEQRCGPLPR